MFSLKLRFERSVNGRREVGCMKRRVMSAFIWLALVASAATVAGAPWDIG